MIIHLIGITEFAIDMVNMERDVVRIFAKVPYPLPLPRPWITYYNGCLNKGSYVLESVAENVS